MMKQLQGICYLLSRRKMKKLSLKIQPLRFVSMRIARFFPTSNHEHLPFLENKKGYEQVCICILFIRKKVKLGRNFFPPPTQFSGKMAEKQDEDKNANLGTV
jgi:hypothetical protein